MIANPSLWAIIGASVIIESVFVIAFFGCDGRLFCIYDVVYAIMYFLSALTFYCLQALCILANVGDGDRAKDFIMGNEDVLKKLMNYMVSSVFLGIALQ